MLSRIIFFIIGFCLMVIGLSYITVYKNLLTFGYSLSEYFEFLVTRYECWYFVIGLLIEIIVVNRKGKIKC